ncbi:endonuclease/exonuclease/phosphatase family protein [Cooperia oncophora]
MNVRSIATAARLADFEAAVENVKFDVIGVSETRMAGKGRIDLSSGYSLYHSGTEERTKRGVGFYVPSSLNQHSDCFFHSERMIELCIKLADRSTLRIIQVHAPHSDFQDVEYEAFLDNLAHVLDARRSKHQVILGDFNATPGLRRNEERYIGNNSSGARNHRGQMLADFCEERKLFLANSFFKKRLDDRWTWRNDALGLKKEIDYVLLRSMKGVVDVGVLTSVNTGSDHRMLRCKMRLNPISQPVRRPRGFPVIDSDLLCSTAQCLLHENMMTGDTIKDYDTITRVITTATQMSTRYEYLPPRLYKGRVLPRDDNGKNRLTATIEEKSILPPEQAGFRKHFSTIDHIHTINMITEKCHEFNIELCAVFVDFKKAFDSVELPMIWKALEYFGVRRT